MTFELCLYNAGTCDLATIMSES